MLRANELLRHTLLVRTQIVLSLSRPQAPFGMAHFQTLMASALRNFLDESGPLNITLETYAEIRNLSGHSGRITFGHAK